MPNFEDTLARMKGLYTYGSELNESKNVSVHTLEHSAKAADGKTYGIIKECNKYYIKAAQKGKETIAESYEYIGGFCNKGNYEYSSYANALKQFGLKMASINEACDANVNISSLDPFRANEVLIEGTDKMKAEIARQRQIMYNVSMLMNEGTEIGASRKDDVVMFDGKNPEAETGKKGDEGGKDATANPDYKGSKTNGVDKKVAPFDQNSPKCADQLKEECNCESENCKCEKFGCDWGSEGMGKGKDPKQVGWEMEGQKTVNEEENDWASKGLPSSPGVGDADTNKNNDPFNKSVNEGCCDNESEDDSAEIGDENDNATSDDTEINDDPEIGGEDLDLGNSDEVSNDDSEDIASDTDFDDGITDVDSEDNMGDDLGVDSDEFDSEDSFDTEEDGEMGDSEMDNSEMDGDIMAQIEELQSQLDSLRAKLNGGEENADIIDYDSFDDEDSNDGLTDDDFSEDDDIVDDDFADDEVDINDDNSDEYDSEDDFNADANMDSEDDDEFDKEENFEGDDLSGEGDIAPENNDSFDDDMDECGVGCEAPVNNQMMESKKAKMDAIVESVVKQILSEDELHDFGKHPGYRKKPMELPSTGEDKNQWGRDWNDESVHGEEPFGSKIGSSAPFTQLVDAVTKNVMSQLTGEAFKGDKKKE